MTPSIKKTSRKRGKNRTEQTADRLRRDIVSGKLAPGTVVRDVDLAKAYGVSTSPIREALILLEMEQLVLMPSQRVRQIAPISRKATEEIGELVILLMEFAIRKGIGRLQRNDLDEMDEHLQAMRIAQAEGNTHVSSRRSRQFYDVIIRAGASDALRRTIMLHAAWIERLFTLAIPVGKSGWVEMADDIYRNLKKGDIEKTMEEVERYHDHFRKLINDLPLSGASYG